MALPELFANSPTPGSTAALTTLNGAIVSTPAAGTQETWTFQGAPPAALAKPGQWRFVVDSEILLDITGGGGTSRTVLRGQEGSTVAAHLNGSAVWHYLTAAGLSSAITSAAVAAAGTPANTVTTDIGGFASYAPAALPWLAVSRNTLTVAQSAQPVLLRGTNIMQAENRNNTVWESVAIPNLVSNWGGNLIIHGFASDPVNAGTTAYLALLDSYVNLCRANGCYLVFAWRSYAQNAGLENKPDTSATYNGPGSSTGSMLALAALAARYNGKSHVMFECQVEPQTGLWSDVQPAYQTIIDAVRVASAPYSPIVFCCGVASGKDISGAISTPVARSNIMYDSHPYTGAANFQQYFGAAYDAGLPVAILEFGPTAFLPQGDIDNTLIPYMRQRGISWAAWTTDYDGSPNLVDRSLTPTSPFGLNTQAAMFAEPPSTGYYENKIDSLTPKVHYELEELTGTTATDISGNAIHGTYVGSPVRGVAGGTYQDFGVTFASASSQRIDIGNVGLPSAATAVGWSIEFWYRCSGAGSNEYIFSASKSSGANPFWGFHHDNTVFTVFARDDAGTTLFNHGTTGVTVNNNLWHHVVWTVNRSGNSTIYVDNVQRGQAACGAGSTVNPDLYCIGATRISNTPANYFNGSVSRMIAYTSELSAAQVNALYSAATGVVYGPDVPLNSSADVLPVEQGIPLVLGAWQSLTLPTHVTNNSGFSSRVALLGNGLLAISAYLTFDGTGIGSNVAFATLPSTSMYPITQKPFSGGSDAAGNADQPVYLDTAGNFKCPNALASLNLRLDGIIPVGF